MNENKMNEENNNNPFKARGVGVRNRQQKRDNGGQELLSVDGTATELSDNFIEKVIDIDIPSKALRMENILPEEEFRKKVLPVIGTKEVGTQYKIVGGVAIASLVALVGGGFFYSLTNDNLSKVVQHSNDFSIDIQRMNILFSESVLGKPDSFRELMDTSAKANVSFKKLYEQTGGYDNGLKSDLVIIDKNIAVLKNNFELLRSSADKVTEFTRDITDMDAKVDRFISIYSRQALNQNELANVYGLKISLQGINANYANILLSDKINEGSVTMLAQNREVFKDILITLKDGDRSKGINQINTRELVEAYNTIVKSWTELSKKITIVTANNKEMIQTKNLNESTYKTIMAIVNKTTKLIQDYKVSEGARLNLAQLAMILGLLLLLISAVTIFYIYSYEKDNRNEEEKYKTSKTEEHIREMTNDLLSIESGNLTKTLKINEGITGYIADSINITIEALRTLVKKIIDTASILEDKTAEVNHIALTMLNITERQTKDIEETGVSVIKISEAINKIAHKTVSGSEEAKRSVEISKSGELQVGQSIEVMREIKINMEDTVALMKKVSESSKQILNIVEILSDINQDTEILSMNATVQATRAGEAGKPFKIVADSIKTLAEKAASEGRRVGSLINGVLSDIKAVEIAVEKTRNEVEHGVDVTEKAFNSFQKMKFSTVSLANTVEEISNEANEHAKKAAEVQYEMREILTTTEINRKSTQQTAKAIEEISKVAKDMATSVNTFTIE